MKFPTPTRDDVTEIILIQLRGKPNLSEITETTCRLGTLLGMDKAGNSIAAKMAMIAMTTSSSMSVNARQICVKTPSKRGGLFPEILLS